MRVLLVNPPYIGWLNDIKVEPIGLLYLASYLRHHGHEVIIHDPYIGHTMEQLEKLMISWKPYVVGCSVYTATEQFCYQIADKVKTIDPGVFVLAGGPHATFCSDIMFERCSSLDAIVHYEGEISTMDIVKRLSSNEKLDGINGVSFRQNGLIVKNTKHPPKIGIDNIPFPAKDLLSDDYYSKSRATAVISGRGCPYKCEFCVSPHFFKGVRLRSISNFMKEIEHCVKTLKVNHIRIYDDVFTINQARIKKFTQLITPTNLTWDCYVRVELATKEMLKMMAEAGCTQIRFGVETGNETFRRKSKGLSATNKKYLQFVEDCKTLGIETFASYIIGFPEETEQDILYTIAFADRLDTNIAGFYKLTPYPGTKYYNMLGEQQDTKHCYTKHNNNISICKNIDPDKLTELLYTAHKRYYSHREIPNDPDILKFL